MAPSETQQMQNAWTYAVPAEESRLEMLREILDALTPARFEPETDPHISILPGFEFPADMRVESLGVRSDGLEGVSISVDGFQTFPETEPFVLALDVTVAADIERIRKDQGESVEQAGGELLYEPVPAHITLVKAGDGGDDPEGLSGVELDALTTALDALGGYATFQTHVAEVDVDTF